jgi:aryl-alcohol dehydrogenase-like predicted oxidoreductase
METRILGRSGLQVGAIGLGCMGMSWAYGQVEDQEGITVIHRAIDLGCTLIDTSDVYGPFTNETLVGKALKGRRDEVVLATKCGLVVTDMETRTIGRNGRPEHIKAACDASLERLGVEVIDLYQLHRVDPEVPVEDSIGAMAELVQAGKVRFIGMSEVDVPTMERANKVYPITSLQSELSLWTRDPLPEILPWCEANDVAFIPFSPLGRGFLTGKISSDSTFGSKDFRSTLPRFKPEALEQNQVIVDKVGEVAERLGVTKSQVAIAWVLAQGEQLVPIPGTKRLSYLEENVAAADVKLSPEDLAELNSLPAPVGTRY